MSDAAAPAAAGLTEALIALGGNIGDVRATFDRAIAKLCDGATVRLAARSSDYRTPPWGVTDQPPFINAVIAVATSLPASELLSRMQDCERALGRERTHERRWGPRAIDIDLLAYDDLVLDDPELTLPHPRLFERAFVLVPLAEIAPGRLIAGVPVSEALRRVEASGIEKLPGRAPDMDLPLKVPFSPMEALSVDEIPLGKEWQYEPKWDGFRALAYRDGGQIELQSKSGRLMTRYFPEVAAALRDLKAQKFVLDGELVVPADGAFSFDALLQRIHPAASRVRKLAVETPALYVVFDLLVGSGGVALTGEPLSQRRNALQAFFRQYGGRGRTVRLSPATTRIADARRWLRGVGATLDGVIAKRRDLDYRSGDRTGMQKIKNYRSADCVVGGFRYNEASPLVGSLLLGLYDEAGLLHHVGFTSTIKREEKPALTAKLKPLIAPPGFTGNAPGGPSRWSTRRSGEWQPLKPTLVVEVCYDHFSGGRFRHGTRLMRWRPDKAPRQCTLDQVTQKKADPLALLGQV